MSNELKITGKITVIPEKITGEKKDGTGTWEKQIFIVDNGEDYNNIIAFEVFGEEKVSKFNKYNKVGYTVDVKFNVSTNEYKGKYFTSLQAWGVFKAEDDTEAVDASELDANDDLPF